MLDSQQRQFHTPESGAAAKAGQKRPLSSVKEHDGSAAKAARFGAAAVCRNFDDASLFRFLVWSASIAGGLCPPCSRLAHFVKYKPREIIVTVPQDKFIKQQR